MCKEVDNTQPQTKPQITVSQQNPSSNANHGKSQPNTVSYVVTKYMDFAEASDSVSVSIDMDLSDVTVSSSE